jgi:pyruvate dehydrogenase E1 component alpha subunit
VADAAGALVEQVREGAGPRLLHAITYRVKGHVSVDPASYRDAAVHAEMLKSDPLGLARARWTEAGGDAAELDAIERAARERIARAVAAADAAPAPEAALAFTDVQDTGSGRWY